MEDYVIARTPALAHRRPPTLAQQRVDVLTQYQGHMNAISGQQAMAPAPDTGTYACAPWHRLGRERSEAAILASVDVNTAEIGSRDGVSIAHVSQTDAKGRVHVIVVETATWTDHEGLVTQDVTIDKVHANRRQWQRPDKPRKPRPAAVLLQRRPGPHV